VFPIVARSFCLRPPPSNPCRIPPSKNPPPWLTQIWRSTIAMELWEEPHKPPDADTGMMTMNKHRPGTRPMLLQTWIEARQRHAPQEHEHDPLSKQPLLSQLSKHPWRRPPPTPSPPKWRSCRRRHRLLYRRPRHTLRQRRSGAPPRRGGVQEDLIPTRRRRRRRLNAATATGHLNLDVLGPPPDRRGHSDLHHLRKAQRPTEARKTADHTGGDRRSPFCLSQTVAAREFERGECGWQHSS
jgi:hypothetical protein